MNNYLFLNHPFFSVVAPSPKQWILIVLFLLGSIVVILAAIVLMKVFNEEKDKKRRMENSDFNVRIYSYDYGRHSLYCFDKMNPSNTKTFSQKEFLDQFVPADRYLVEDWLKDIASGNKKTDFIQADIRLNKNRKTLSSMLELVSVNRKKHIIHFNSHLLPYIYSTNLKPKKSSDLKVPKKYLLKTTEDAEKFMSNTSLDNLGSLYYIRLFNRNRVLTKEDLDQLASVNEGIFLTLGKFLTKDRKMIRISAVEEVIIDKTSISKFQAMNFASTLQTQIQQYLNARVPNSNIAIAVGVTNGTFDKNHYTLGKDQAAKMTDAIARGMTQDKILFYDEDFFVNYQQTKAQKDEVRMVIKNATFRVYFTPCLNVTNGKKNFYLLTISPYGTTVKDFSTILNIGEEYENGNETLFTSMKEKIEMVIPKNSTQKYLFAMELPYRSLPTFVETIPDDPGGKIQWILAVRESDIINSDDDTIALVKKFRSYQKRGYYIGIIIDNPNSDLPSIVLKNVSVFFVPSTFLKMDGATINQSRNDLKSIQTTYSAYHVPLVFYGLKSISEMEFGIHYGGRIFQCQELAMPSSRIEDLEQDLVDEIMETTIRLVPTLRQEIAAIKQVSANSEENDNKGEN